MALCIVKCSVRNPISHPWKHQIKHLGSTTSRDKAGLELANYTHVFIDGPHICMLRLEERGENLSSHQQFACWLSGWQLVSGPCACPARPRQLSGSLSVGPPFRLPQQIMQSNQTSRLPGGRSLHCDATNKFKRVKNERCTLPLLLV